MISFGGLKFILRRRSITHRKFSEITGISVNVISLMCRDNIKYLSLDKLNKICTALNCKPGEIIKYIPDED